jgi:hypothetical protein
VTVVESARLVAQDEQAELQAGLQAGLRYDRVTIAFLHGCQYLIIVEEFWVKSELSIEMLWRYALTGILAKM